MFRLPIFTVLALLTVHGANPSVGDDRLPTPIEEAVEKADAAEVKRLLAIDPESVKKTFGDDGTLLHVAVVLGHKEIAELLLAKGADPNAANADGHTALHQAAEYGRLEIANMLVEKGASVSAGKDRGCTPLHIAVMNGWVEVAAWLIEHGSPLGVENQRGQSELHFAVHCRNAAEMIKLLATKGANVNHRDCDGYSPLHLSLLGENAVATVATLLTAGADPNARNKTGNTPLCRTLGSTAMVELLLDNGAEENGLIPPGRSEGMASRRREDSARQKCAGHCQGPEGCATAR
ncbi:MAG: ankyrin repeat domain-containing protein, partial [Planctomycetes bacterium]|nr:ankyrin repeat domain-containing protein [Planctomycetota bacterium]